MCDILPCPCLVPLSLSGNQWSFLMMKVALRGEVTAVVTLACSTVCAKNNIVCLISHVSSVVVKH